MVGGGSSSLLWRQIISDVLGVKVVGFKIPDSAALGAAIQAAGHVEAMKQEKKKEEEHHLKHTELDTSSMLSPNATTKTTPTPSTVAVCSVGNSFFDMADWISRHHDAKHDWVVNPNKSVKVIYDEAFSLYQDRARKLFEKK